MTYTQFFVMLVMALVMGGVSYYVGETYGSTAQLYFMPIGMLVGGLLAIVMVYIDHKG